LLEQTYSERTVVHLLKQGDSTLTQLRVNLPKGYNDRTTVVAMLDKLVAAFFIHPVKNYYRLNTVEQWNDATKAYNDALANQMKIDGDADLSPAGRP
jgi:hypothetical protein